MGNLVSQKVIWIVHTSSSGVIGGAQTTRIQFSKAFLNKGYKVVWWTSAQSEKSKIEQDKPIAEVDVRPIDTVTLPIKDHNIYPTLKAIANFIMLFNREKPTKIIFHNYNEFHFPLIIILRLMGQSERVVQLFQTHPDFWDTNLREKVAKWLFSDSKIIKVAVSQWVANSVKGKGIPGTITVRYPPTYQCDCRVKTKLNHSGNLRVECITRISQEKGLDVLGKIAKESKKRNLPIDFYLVGNAVDKNFLQELEEEFNGAVKILGPKLGEQLCEEYKKADITILLSSHEAFGLVIVESLIHGTPVIVRGTPNAEEILAGSNPLPGLMVSLNDSEAVDKTIEFLEKVISDKELLPKLSQSALKTSEKFEPQKTINEFVSLVVN